MKNIKNIVKIFVSFFIYAVNKHGEEIIEGKVAF